MFYLLIKKHVQCWVLKLGQYMMFSDYCNQDAQLCVCATDIYFLLLPALPHGHLGVDLKADFLNDLSMSLMLMSSQRLLKIDRTPQTKI